MLLLYVLNFEWDSDHTWSVAWSHSSCKDRKGLQMLPVYFETVLMVASSNKPLRHFSKLGYNPRHKEYWKNQGHNLRTINLSICRPSTMWRACILLCGIWQHVCQMCWLNWLAAVKKKKSLHPWGAQNWYLSRTCTQMLELTSGEMTHHERIGHHTIMCWKGFVRTCVEQEVLWTPLWVVSFLLWVSPWHGWVHHHWLWGYCWEWKTPHCSEAGQLLPKTHLNHFLGLSKPCSPPA